jgi:hypothetical protein
MIQALPRFFVISGAVLIVTGVLKLIVRPRAPREGVLERWLNRSSLWALFCMAVGVAGILIGLGVIPLRVGLFG